MVCGTSGKCGNVHTVEYSEHHTRLVIMIKHNYFCTLVTNNLHVLILNVL